ncbi:DUF1488 domain-containing protein [Burkholderia sp. Bp9002]|nr:DUF1488 domain-containing protein [Burkholderia sp. Bp9125]RQS03762.1 DUF1488 domain-containing protein [Burkholderia sp. Bp9002]
MPKHVTFPDVPPVFDGATLALRFVAEVDGTPVDCAITAEALEDHFGARSALEAELRAAFERGCARIRDACTELLADTEGGVILHSGYFRVRDGGPGGDASGAPPSSAPPARQK